MQLAFDAGAFFGAALLGPAQLGAEKRLQLIQGRGSGMPIGAKLCTSEHDIAHPVCRFRAYGMDCLREAHVTAGKEATQPGLALRQLENPCCVRPVIAQHPFR